MQPGDLMLEAIKIALKSRDDSTKVGSVIWDETEGIVAKAWNSFPEGVAYTKARTERPAKYNWTVHAEANVITSCAKYGYSTDGCTLVSTQIPCSTCMGLIIQSGITKVICPDYKDLAPKWREDAAISIAMALEANIDILFTDTHGNDAYRKF